MSSNEVRNVATFVAFAQQNLGTASGPKQYPMVQKQAKQFFNEYPKADWRTLARIVEWAVQKRRRTSLGRLISLYVYAFEDGYLPELEVFDGDEKVEAGIEDALEIEEDSQWRTRLIRAQGDARTTVLKEWEKAHAVC